MGCLRDVEGGVVRDDHEGAASSDVAAVVLVVGVVELRGRGPVEDGMGVDLHGPAHALQCRLLELAPAAGRDDGPMRLVQLPNQLESAPHDVLGVQLPPLPPHAGLLSAQLKVVREVGRDRQREDLLHRGHSAHPPAGGGRCASALSSTRGKELGPRLPYGVASAGSKSSVTTEHDDDVGAGQGGVRAPPLRARLCV